jgi:hypothetical protein
MNDRQITLKSIVSVSKSQTYSELLGEIVILELESGVYYGLNETGSRIWSLIQQSKTVAEIRNTLLAEYEIDSESCTRYVVDLIEDLNAKNLVVVKNETVV